MTLRSRLHIFVPAVMVLSLALACPPAHAQAPPPPPPPPTPAPSDVEPIVTPPQQPSPAESVDTPPPVGSSHAAAPCIPPSWITAQNAVIRELIVLQAGEAAAVTEERSEGALTEDKILKKRLQYLKALIKLSRPHR